MAVLAAGRHRGARGALAPAAPPSPAQHKALALYLADAYCQAIAPAAAVGSYARAVLEDAYRRAYEACGQQMAHLAASGAAREDLDAQLEAMCTDLAELSRRAQRAAKPQRSQP